MDVKNPNRFLNYFRSCLSSEKMSAVHMFLLLAIAESAAKPSIFFMLADDLGWNNLGWNNKEV